MSLSVIAFSENGPFVTFDITKTIRSSTLITKVVSVLIVDQCKNGKSYFFKIFQHDCLAIISFRLANCHLKISLLIELNKDSSKSGMAVFNAFRGSLAKSIVLLASASNHLKNVSSTVFRY